jgi:hypothetical protein
LSGDIRADYHSGSLEDMCNLIQFAQRRFPATRLARQITTDLPNVHRCQAEGKETKNKSFCQRCNRYHLA